MRPNKVEGRGYYYSSAFARKEEKMKGTLRSKGLSPDVPQYYIRRALMKSMGYTDRDLEKPLVAIANTWNEILPGSYHLNKIGIMCDHTACHDNVLR